MLPGYSRSRCRNALLFIAVSAPLIAWYGETLPSHNEIETWLPTNSVQRREHDRFKEYFGAEEFVLVGMSTTRHDADLIEAVCCRIESLDSIRACWSPARMTTVMDDLEVPEELIRDRLRGLTMSWDGEFAGLLAILNNNGLANRAGTVDSIRSVLDYCRIPRDEVHLAGSPVVVAELDRLGSRDNNLLFFGAACAISFVLLLSVFRHWKVAAAVFALTLWAIEVTLAILHLFDGEMNFILSALPVMVMVFTLTVAIHFVHYYRQAKSTIDPIRSALRNAMWPCFLATATTVIGLLSLATSDMRPVRLFGLSAAVGCVVALVTGLFLTPAVLVLYPLPEPSSTPINRRPLTFAASLLFRRSGTFALAAFALVAVSAIGLTRLKSNIDPLEFLPANSKVLADVRLLQQRIGNTSSIEAVVDFRNEDLPFVAKLDAVQNFERRLCSNPAVIDTISVGTFLPLSLPENTLDARSGFLGSKGVSEFQRESVACLDTVFSEVRSIRAAAHEQPATLCRWPERSLYGCDTTSGVRPAANFRRILDEFLDGVRDYLAGDDARAAVSLVGLCGHDSESDTDMYRFRLSGLDR